MNLIVTERVLEQLRELVGQAVEPRCDAETHRMSAIDGGNFDDTYDAGYERGYNEALREFAFLLDGVV